MSNSLEPNPDQESLPLEWPISADKLTRIGESLATHRAGSGRPHKGVDLFAPLGSPVVAAGAGKVLRVLDGTGSMRRSLQRAGWFVDVLGEDGRVYRYLHLAAQPTVRAGQLVAAGTRLGSVGTSGIHHARPHIHFEVRRGDYDGARKDYGEPVDPLTVLPGAAREKQGDLMAQNSMRWSAAETQPSTPPSAIDLDAPDAQAALKFLVSKGWTPDEVRQLLDKHVPPEEPEPGEPEKSDRSIEEHLLSLGWSRSDIARFLVGPEQASQTAEALFRQHAANSSADQQRLVQALTQAGAKAVKPDPQLLDGLDPGHLQPESPSDLESLIAQFAQLPDVQKQRFLLLLDSQKSKGSLGGAPNEGSPAPKSSSDNGGGKTAKAPQSSDAGGDVLPVVKSSLDLLSTALKGLLGATGAGKRTQANKNNAKQLSDSDLFAEEEGTDTEPDKDNVDDSDVPDTSDPADWADSLDPEEENPPPVMPEQGIGFGDEREPD